MSWLLHQRNIRWLPALVALAMPRQLPAQTMPPATVAVAQAVARNVAAGQTFVATIMPDKRAVVGSAVDGRVVELVVEAGDRVEDGQALAQLLTETIKLELVAAKATLDLRREQLSELENGSRPEEIAQAKAKMLAAESTMQYREARRRRLEDLRRTSRAVTEDEYDAAVSEAATAQQNYLDAQAAYELAVEGPREEKIAQAGAQVAYQQAEVERIEDRIKKYTVRARFAGYVVEEFVEAGSWVQTGDPVVELVALDELEAEVFVPESQVPSIVPGMEVRVEIPALADQIFTGQVAAIVPQADAKARTFPVKIRLKNEIGQGGPLLKAGMYARVALPTGQSREAVLVPKDALVLGGPRPVVYVVGPGEGETRQARPAEVQLGVAVDSLIQVVGAVAAGDLVVIEGNERLRPGQPVSLLRRESLETAASSAD